MADAFIYMYVVGSGTALGVASVTWLSWKVVQRSNSKGKVSKRRGAF